MRLIDADKLLEVLNKKSVPFNANVNDAILTAPTVEERKEGEWIAVSEYGRWMRKCNSCGWKQFIDSPKMIGWHYNYCPNCGAKMERKEE